MKLQPILRGLAGVIALLVPGRKAKAVATVAAGVADLLPAEPVEEIIVPPVGVAVPDPAPVRVAPALVLSDEDFEAAWRTVYGEARGEGFAGMVAVAWVIRNRLDLSASTPGRHWWGETVSAICRAKAQFSCWWDHNADDVATVPLSDAVARQCQRAVLDVFAGMMADPTVSPVLSGLGGATHYFAHKLVRPPSWAAGRPRLSRIGGHDFYRVV